MRQVQRRDRENVLGVGNYCYVAYARRRWSAHGGGEGRGISCRHAHSLFFMNVTCASVVGTTFRALQQPQLQGVLIILTKYLLGSSQVRKYFASVWYTHCLTHKSVENVSRKKNVASPLFHS